MNRTLSHAAGGRSLAGLSLVLVILAGACAGGTLSARGYFLNVQRIAEEVRVQEGTAQPSQTETANLSPDGLKQKSIELLNVEASITEHGIDQVEGLKPPDDIRDAHDAFVQAGKDLAKTLKDFAAQAQNIPPDQIEEFFSTTVFAQSTFATFDQACSALAKIASDKKVDVSLNCTE